MADRWVTLKSAARVAGVSVDTVKRYIERDGMRSLNGVAVTVSDVMAAKRAARERMRGGAAVREQGPKLERAAAEFAETVQLDEAGRRVVTAFVQYIEKR